MTYFDLSIPMRCLILLGCFLSIGIGGYLITGVYRRKSRQHSLLLFPVSCRRWMKGGSPLLRRWSCLTSLMLSRRTYWKPWRVKTALRPFPRQFR